MPIETTYIIKNRSDKEKTIKDAIFAFSGGTRSILLRGEGDEISTAVEIAEIIKNRMYPSLEIANISLGSRPYFDNRSRGYNRNDRNNRNSRSSKNSKDLISKIEITLSKSNQ
jgi:DNA-binding protein Alba